MTALGRVDVERILKGDCADVFSVLGMHKSPDGGEGDLVVGGEWGGLGFLAQ